MAWSVAIPAIAAIAGLLFGGKKTGQQSSEDLGQMTQEDFAKLLQIPEIRDYFKLQQAQTLRMEPLQQAVSQLAYQLLPTHAKGGISYNQVPTPPLSTFPASTPSSYGSAAPPGGYSYPYPKY